MSDIILGTIIGGGIGVVASIVGGIVSYLVAKLQINARRQEQADQFANRKQESQMDRLIEARKAWLEPLSKDIQACVKTATEVEGITLNLKARCDLQPFWGDSQYGQSSKALVQATGNMIEICRDMRDLTEQVSDGSLNRLIHDMILLPFNIHSKVFDLPDTDATTWLPQAGGKKEKNASKTCEAICGILNDLREYSWKINKRIEELLSGAD